MMAICGSYMFKCSVSNGTKPTIHKKGDGRRTDSETIVYGTNWEGIKNQC